MNTDMIALSIAAWSAGIDQEARFWENWVKTGGSHWPRDFEARLRADRMFPANLESLLPAVETINVLDVGAGPMTVLGTRSAGRSMQIVATDPLAGLYEHILTTHGVMPPVPTVFATAEDLSAFFGSSRFDLVHCQNALDHSFDPVRGITEMLRVVKVGGNIVLLHQTNEAEWEHYVGLHQFNFDKKDGRFYIWNRKSGVFPEENIQCGAVFETRIHPSARSIIVVIRKTSEFADVSDGSRFRQRTCELTEGLINHFLSRSIEQFTASRAQSPEENTPAGSPEESCPPRMLPAKRSMETGRARAPTTKFCIMTARRSGSNFLVSALANCPMILCHGEIFHEEIFHEDSSEEMSREYFDTLDFRVREQDPAKFVDQVYAMNTNVHAAGFKMFRDQSPVALAYILADRDIKKIVLRRDNILASYSSLQLARKTGLWQHRLRSAAPLVADSPRPAPDILEPGDDRVIFDPVSFRSFWDNESETFDYYHGSIAAAGGIHLDVDYLALTGGDFSSIERFLELPAGFVWKSDIGRLNTSRILDRFYNPGDVLEFARKWKIERWLQE